MAVWLIQKLEGHNWKTPSTDHIIVHTPQHKYTWFSLKEKEPYGLVLTCYNGKERTEIKLRHSQDFVNTI